MPNYYGQPCTSCRNILTEKDDIVVCPECGSPYHRECYKKEGKCINTLLHETGESWQPEVTQEAAKEHKTVICGSCGMENDSEVPFCKNCGAPINMEKAADGYAGSEAGGNAQNNTSNQNGPYQNGPFMNGFPFAGFKPINPDDTIDGISVGDYVKYIGQNFFYFIPKFMRFSKGSKVSFNFSAFLFPHLYFFYRKMIPQGIIMLILQVVLSIPSVLFLFGEYGYISIDTLANASWFLYLANIFSIIAYIVDIAVGIFANWMYYRKAKKDITKIKSTIIEDNAQSTAIASGGGTSWAYVVAAFMAVLTLNLIIVFVMTKLIL